jgi:hypothetical protein
MTRLQEAGNGFAYHANRKQFQQSPSRHLGFLLAQS